MTKFFHILVEEVINFKMSGVIHTLIYSSEKFKGQLEVTSLH